jgi:hypothetical protein
MGGYLGGVGWDKREKRKEKREKRFAAPKAGMDSMGF